MYASVKYWVWLADLLPPAAGHRVYAFFQSPTEAFLSDNGRYDLIPGLTRQQRELLCHASLDRAEQIVEECARQGIRVVTWQDADYPERLRLPFRRRSGHRHSRYSPRLPLRQADGLGHRIGADPDGRSGGHGHRGRL